MSDRRWSRLVTVALGLGLWAASLAGGAAARADEAQGGLRYTVAVTKFENRSNWSGQWALADTFGAILTDALQQTGRVIVLGEADMRRAAMAEQDFSASGRVVQGAKTPRIGQMTPAQLLVKGEITHFEASTGGGSGGISVMGLRLGGGKETAEIRAVIYVVDSTTGMVVASKRVAGKASKRSFSVGFSDRNWGADLAGFRKTSAGEAVEKAVDEAVAFIIGQLEEIPWTGSVVLVKGEKVYINRGEREGVRVGQTFLVGQREELRDPDTGELLDVSLEPVGKIQVLRVKKKIAICKALEGADRIARGMVVTLP